MSTRTLELLRALLLGALLTLAARAEETKKSYDLAAGDAAATLKQFAEVSGRETLFAAEVVRGVKTQPVKGRLTAQEALDALLAETGLFATPDEKTGAFAVRRGQADPNGPRAARQENSARRPSDPSNRDGTIVMKSVEVTGTRLRQQDVEGPSPVTVFNNDFLVRTGFGTLEEFMRTLPQNFAGAGSGRQSVPNDENPTFSIRQPGQSGLGLRGLGSSSTLVLINGRRAPLSGVGNQGTATQQSFFDINTIPIGLIERIEILTDGASAVYGADAIAGVVNIILKDEYRGTELRTRVAGTWHGGGFERGATLTHGLVSGKLRVTLTLDWFERKELTGDQRPFSKSSDHRERGGSDFRSNIAYPNTIFALPGQTLAGVFNPNGTPATQAVVPAGQDGRNLTVAAFNATAGQEMRASQSRYYSLITPTERRSATAKISYDISDRLKMYSDIVYTRNDASALANPVFNSAQTGAGNVRIPATNPYNPFNQALGFRMAHDELGPRELKAITDSWRLLLGGELELGRGWSVQSSIMAYQQDFFNSSPQVDNAALIAALNQTDPNLALNLFGDFYGVGGPTNAPGVYESIIRRAITETEAIVYNADALLRGSLAKTKAGDIKMAVGAEWSQQDRLRTTNTPTAFAPAESSQVRNDYAAYAELAVPVFGGERRLPLVRRLDLSLAARYQDIENAGSSFDPKYGVRWQPFDALMLRGSFTTGYRAPALSELERPEAENTVTIIDRKRNNQAYPVLRISGSFPNLEPETSETINYGVLITMPGVKGLSFGVDAYRTDQRNLTASLTQQQLVDFEDLFPSRIIRNPANPADVAAGLPGQIAEVDARFSNFGRVVTEGFDFTASYNFSQRPLGRFQLRAVGTYLASYKVAFNPGDALVERRGSFGFPQKLKGNASLFWYRGAWGGSIFCYYLGEVERVGQTLPSFTTVDVSLSREWSKKLRIQGGIGNLFDREPPFANTTFGYDGGFHSAKMRTYHASVIYTF